MPFRGRAGGAGDEWWSDSCAIGAELGKRRRRNLGIRGSKGGESRGSVVQPGKPLTAGGLNTRGECVMILPALGGAQP